MKKISFLVFLLLSVVSVSCRHGADLTPEDEVRNFGNFFVEKASAGQIDSLKPFYSSIVKADGLVDLQSDTIVVKETAPGEYDVRLTEDVMLKVKRADDGKVKVVESRGLFAFPEDKLNLAKKTGLWDDKINDLELSRRMADGGFFAWLYSKAGKIKDNLLTVNTKYIETRVDGYITGPETFPEHSEGYRTITNNTDQPIYPEDYNMNFKDVTTFIDDTDDEATYNRYTKPGREIEPRGTARVEGGNSFSRDGYYKEFANLVGVTILLSDEAIMNRFAKFTGNEYQEYLNKK